MGVKTDLLKNIKRAIDRPNTPLRVPVGEIPKQSLQDLEVLSDLYYSPDILATVHALNSRSVKDGWTPEQIYGAYEKLLASPLTRAVPNPPQAGRRGTEALWLPLGRNSLYAPVKPGEDGKALALTIYDPPARRIGKALQAYAKSPDSNLDPEQLALIREVLKDSKWGPSPGASALASGGLLGILGSDSEAQAPPLTFQPDETVPVREEANYLRDGEPGLESASFGPTEIILAIASVPSLFGKLAAAAAEPFIEPTLNKAGGLLEVLGQYQYPEYSFAW